MLEVKFVCSENNTADILTKNLWNKLFAKHSKGLGMQSDADIVKYKLDAYKEGVTK